MLEEMLNTAKYKVTVLMTVYNCAETIAEAVDSILNQSFKDFCIVLCDDCSVDSTYEILLQKYFHLNNIYIIRNNRNLGRATSSNNCLRIIDSEYVARMDGDDISLAGRLQAEVDFLDNNHEFDLVSTPMIYFDEKGDYRIGRAVEYPDISDFSSDTPFCHGPSLIRTNAIKSLGGYSEAKNIIRVEDVDLWYRLYMSGYKGYNIQQPLYKMRNDKKTFSRRKPKYRLLQFLHGYQMRRKLGVPHAFWVSLPYFIKIFIPWQVFYYTRRLRR